jgi:hypothetical protein
MLGATDELHPITAPMHRATVRNAAVVMPISYNLTAPTSLFAGRVALASGGAQVAVKENIEPTALLVAGNPWTVISPLCAWQTLSVPLWKTPTLSVVPPLLAGPTD